VCESDFNNWLTLWLLFVGSVLFVEGFASIIVAVPRTVGAA
jgi:hypothetical protein